MSHFSVLVIGPDHKAHLAPYHEFESTGIADQYAQSIDKTEEVRAEYTAKNVTKPFLAWASTWYGWPIVQLGQEPDIEGEHKYGYITLNEAGEVDKCIRRTNQNRKWDWYVVGGRWAGFFKLKPGATGLRGENGVMGSCRSNDPDRADQLRKGDVDIDGMREAAGREAGERWDRAAAAADGRTWVTWETMRDVRHAGNIAAAREAYHAQQTMADVSRVMGHPWDGVDEYLTPRDVYVQIARDKALSTYAVLHRGQWIARGDMGWFGISRDEGDEADWARKFNELIDSLPNDTMLTVVDCHI